MLKNKKDDWEGEIQMNHFKLVFSTYTVSHYFETNVRLFSCVHN